MADPSNDGAPPVMPEISPAALAKLGQRIQSDLDRAALHGNEGNIDKKIKHDRRRKERKERIKTAKLTTTAATTTSTATTTTPHEPKPCGNASSNGPATNSSKKKKAKKAKIDTAPDAQAVVQVVTRKQQQQQPQDKTAAKSKKDRPAPAWKPQRTNPGTQYDVPATTRRGANNSRPAAADPFPKKAGSGRIDKEALLKEIIELGGTADDLALVDGIDSDDDDADDVVALEEQPTTAIKRADIEAFMDEIGLQRGAALEDDHGTDEEEKEDEGGEDEDDDQEDDSSKEDDDGKEDDDVETADAVTPTAPNRNTRLVFPKRPDWHAEPLPALNCPKTPPTPQQANTLRDRARALLQAENEAYSKTELAKSSDRQFLSQIMRSGTLADKISALTLVCQESPLHTMKTLEGLLALAQKKSRSQAVQALGAIKDLFAQGVCLPPTRKLKFFAKQPLLGAKGTADIHLLAWAYEDWLKNLYFEVLKCLEQLCTDQLVYARTHAVGYVYELLKEKPEQEANLLRLLVNKIGDSDKKVASKVSFLLLQLMVAHPAMKGIVIKALESEVVFRPGNQTNAKYYAIITLNQTILSSLEHDIANKLLDIYFGVFAALLRKENAAPAAAQNASGPNAAGLRKHAKLDDERKASKLNKKARLRAKKQDEQSQLEEESHAKLVSAVLTGVNRAFPFSKVEDDVFDQHMDTLFRITHEGNFNTSIQALILIFQVSNAKQAVSDRFYRTLYESLLDQRLITSSKQALYLNLLFRALKTDTSVKRVKAFVKRILQVATLHQPSFICGVLYLLHELAVNIPSIRTLLTDPEPNEEDDEEEIFRDVPDSSDTEAPPPAPPPQPPTVAPKQRPVYDGRKRDPLHAEADRSCLWELLPFVNHFHPAVALYAQCLLAKKPMPSKPDLGMHTLVHFLDRFVYRNAKTSAAAASGARGTSIMQPLAGGRSVGVVLATRDRGAAMQPVNAEAFWKKNVEDVVPEEVFFHKYFNLVRPAAAAGKAKTPGKKRKRGGDEDQDDEDDSEAEGEIWKALVESQPELDGDDVDFDDDDDDLDVNVDDDSDLVDMDSGGEEAEWSTEEDGDEDEASGEAAAVFEAQLAKASAKRQKMMEVDSDDDDGGINLLDLGDDDDDKEGLKKKQKKDDRKDRKKKLKSLPTFASVEDYADMLSDSE